MDSCASYAGAGQKLNHGSYLLNSLFNEGQKFTDIDLGEVSECEEMIGVDNSFVKFVR